MIVMLLITVVFFKSMNGTHSSSSPSRTDFLNLRDCSCRQNAVGMFAMKASPIVVHRNMLGQLLPKKKRNVRLHFQVSCFNQKICQAPCLWITWRTRYSLNSVFTFWRRISCILQQITNNARPRKAMGPSLTDFMSSWMVQLSSRWLETLQLLNLIHIVSCTGNLQYRDQCAPGMVARTKGNCIHAHEQIISAYKAASKYLIT